MTTAIMTLMVGIIGLITYILKRRSSPSIEEQVYDNRSKYTKLMLEMYKLRDDGDDAGADAILRRLQDSAAIGSRNWQRGDGDVATRDKDRPRQEKPNGVGQ